MKSKSVSKASASRRLVLGNLSVEMLTLGLVECGLDHNFLSANRRFREAFPRKKASHEKATESAMDVNHEYSRQYRDKFPFDHPRHRGRMVRI